MKMKSLQIDAIMPWEFGLLIIIIGFLLIFIGIKQSRKEFDINNMPFTRPTTKILFGTFFAIIGGIQLFPLLD